MKDLGELKYFLGIKFSTSKEGILMHQRKYSLELISELGLSTSKPAYTPIHTNLKLKTKECDDHLKVSCIEDPLLPNLWLYQRLIGRLLYLTVTRPDIGFSGQTLSQYLQHPNKSHMEAALKIVRYIKSQSGKGIFISSNPIQKMTAFCDAY
ncbi:uncharacterized mitochondrial protein AtMg00810-like [Lycium barbarum]|uniref:uncharacterized mitochondrial protein AtMg00810-like n=1 Tax=Lycium barbarum TaxID=112863 RepID=UPI00293F0452|nr:uncharacterized mitochondrial protein AtMg00810-like [Lycium barbarum]